MQVALLDQAQPFRQPSAYPPELIERALLETALCGGNARKASRNLAAFGVPIPHERISAWRRGRYANRYSEICSAESAALRERIAAGALDLSTRIQEVEGDAVDRVASQLAEANAVEASIILKNLSTSKQIALNQEGLIRGRATEIVEHRGIEQLTGDLVKLGVGTVIDSDAEEIADAEVVPAPAIERT
jgi:hypothetical protein